MSESVVLKERRRRRRRSSRPTEVVGFLNLTGARRQQKWEELFSQLDDEKMILFGVAETHLRDLEEAPTNENWCWAGRNRVEGQRRGGGVGVVWRNTSVWQKEPRECWDHIWVTGEIICIPVAVCIVYLSVGTARREENQRLMACVTTDAKALAATREILIMGDFNGHLHELDGLEDENGRMMMQMAEDNALEIVNLRASCEGQYTWSARGSKTCIDYALVSQNLARYLVHADIDEAGDHSVGSDHNRIRLKFSKATRQLRKQKPPRIGGFRLSPTAAEKVVEEFENSSKRVSASGYAEYVDELKRLIKQHSTKERGGRRQKKRWWDAEVQAAIRLRQELNREHRTVLLGGHSDQYPLKWHAYKLRKQAAK